MIDALARPDPLPPTASGFENQANGAFPGNFENFGRLRVSE
jgi:hypothetical protein